MESKQALFMVAYNWLSPMNSTILTNGFTILTTLRVWLPLGASSPVALFVVAVLIGVGTGSFVALGGVFLSPWPWW
ncbi:hypothetical protein N0V88_004380 [Collariella sp. IMI 366227]|nr:hypothetical protein N0V88_004380 [Collariella sp. IMI 366227]